MCHRGTPNFLQRHRNKNGYRKIGVYLIDFSHSRGGELSGKHYAIAVTVFNKEHKTFVVVPIISKKSGKNTEVASQLIVKNIKIIQVKKKHSQWLIK